MSTTLEGKAAPEPFKASDDQLIEFLQQRAVFHNTKRFKTLDRKDAFLKCREYDHQEIDWFDKSADQMETISAEAVYPAGTQPSGGAAQDLEVRERRPTAPTRRAKVTSERYTNLLFSERSKPKIIVDQDTDTDAMLDAIRGKAKFWSKVRAARNLGGGIGSVVMTVHVRANKWSYEVHNSKFCTPVWKDPRDRSLSALLIMYRTQKEENELNDKKQIVGTKLVDYLCRRIITENREIVYKEMRFDDVINNPGGSWIIDEGLDVEHGLGRFPGVWIQNTAVENDDGDGESDCDGAYQAIDTNDRLISQAVYGSLGNMDPTVVTSTDPKAVQQINALQGGLAKGSKFAIETGVGGSAEYMEMSGGGITSGMALSDKLEAQIDVITGVVIPDDATMAAAQSAEALELRFAPMLAKAADLREQYGEAIVELMQITELIARKFLSQPAMQLPPDAAGNPRIGQWQFDLPLRKTKVTRGDDMVDVSEPHKLGVGGYISLEWGPWFPPTEGDKGSVIRNSAAAVAARFVTQLSGARRVAPFFGVQDVEGEVSQALQEAKQDAEEQLGQYEGAVVRTAAQGRP